MGHLLYFSLPLHKLVQKKSCAFSISTDISFGPYLSWGHLSYFPSPFHKLVLQSSFFIFMDISLCLFNPLTANFLQEDKEQKMIPTVQSRKMMSDTLILGVGIQHTNTTWETNHYLTEVERDFKSMPIIAEGLFLQGVINDISKAF